MTEPRSWLFVPADSERKIAKALESEADAVIGRTVTSEDGKTTGVVKEVKLYSDGIIAVLDNGKELVIGPGVKVK